MRIFLKPFFLILISVNVLWGQAFSEAKELFSYETDRLNVFQPIDFNQDSLIDFLGIFPPTIAINNGDGTFTQEAVGRSNQPILGAVDIDGDGALEILEKAGWYTEVDGEFVFQFIGDSQKEIKVFEDLDNDGDIDLILFRRQSFSASDSLLLWRNEGTFFSSSILDVGQKYDDIFTMQVNPEDNRLDLIATKNGEIAIFTQQEDMTFEKSEQSLVHPRFTVFVPHDMDGDGDLDLVHSSRNGFETFGWTANEGGQFNGTTTIVNTVFGEAYIVVDIDGNQTPDIIGFDSPNSSSDELNIGYINNTGRGFDNFVKIGEIPGIDDGRLIERHYLFPLDMDGDEDLDLVVNDSEGRKVIWFENESLVSSTKTLNSLNRFIVSPNPTKEQLSIDLQFDQVIPTTLKILDLFGKVLWTQELPKQKEQQINVNLSNYSAGIYLIQIQGEDGIKVQKVIKN